MKFATEKEEEEIEKVAETIRSAPRKAKEFWHNLGPGLTTGASDDDPAGIATYSQTGAAYGSQLVWLSLFTFPLMAVVQEIGAQKGLLTRIQLEEYLAHAPEDYKPSTL